MDAKKWEGLKKKAMITLVAVVPAVASGILSYTESRDTAEKGTEEASRKAEAGYRITMAAYEQMLKDITALKTEIRLLRELLMNGNISPPSVGTEAHLEPQPDPPDSEDIQVEGSGTRGTVTLKKNELPQDLDAAQKMLE